MGQAKRRGTLEERIVQSRVKECMKNRYCLSIDFVSTEVDAERIAVAIGEAAVKAGQDAGGEQVISQPFGVLETNV